MLKKTVILKLKIVSTKANLVESVQLTIVDEKTKEVLKDGMLAGRPVPRGSQVSNDKWDVLQATLNNLRVKTPKININEAGVYLHEEEVEVPAMSINLVEVF